MSGASSRRKGNVAERDVVRVLREAGYKAETSRASRGGYQTGADILSDFPATIEVKNQARLDLAGWWSQAEAQAIGGGPAVVIHKRVGKARAEDWWCTMDFKTLISLLRPASLPCLECSEPVSTNVWDAELGLCIDCSNDYFSHEE